MGKYLVVAIAAALLTSAVPAGAANKHSTKAVSSGTQNLSVGTLHVNGVLRVQRNTSTYGRLYAHGSLQVWNGLTVRSGGLHVAGPMTVQSAVVAGALQAGPVSASSLTLNGPLTASGHITGNGVDAGAGGIATTGSINGGALTATSVNDSGALNAGSATLGALTVNGTVDLKNATMSGLTVTNLVASNGLTIGGSSGKTTQLGVNGSGALTVGDLAATGSAAINGSLSIGGNLSVGGSTSLNLTNLAVSSLSAPNGGALKLQGNGISLTGDTVLNAGGNLIMTVSGGNAGQILANGDNDLAGVVSITVNAGMKGGYTITPSFGFSEPFAAPPIVTVTPVDDPAYGGPAPKYWVTASTTGFTIHYAPMADVTNGYSVRFYYHVIGS